MTEWRTY